MSQLITQGLEGMLQTERSRVVGLCAMLSGNIDVAEDLAQEVMLEAWRSLERLHDPALFTHWLSGIARNVCLRWRRKQVHNLAYSQRELSEEMIDDFNLEIELERKELIELLDRALAMLPPDTRKVLIARYVEESPLSELAEQLGMQTSTVAMRLHRGKLALRHVLKNDLSAAALEYDLLNKDEYEETNIWCTICGHHRLRGQFRPVEGKLFLTCPQCGKFNHTDLIHTSEAKLFYGIKHVKPALNRVCDWMLRFYGIHLDERKAPCLRCGCMVPLQILSSLDEINREDIFGPGWRNDRGAYQYCRTCNLHNWASLGSLVLVQPEGQRFMSEHRRIHELPEQEVEVDGLPAVVKRFESITNQSRHEVIFARDTFQILCVNGKHT